MSSPILLGLELPPLTGPAGSAIERAVRHQAAAAAAERAGFSVVWCAGLASCTQAGALVGSTASITLGAMDVVDQGHGYPTIVAREVTSLDVVSEGRAALLLVGETSGARWPELATEAVEICRQMFEHAVAQHDGRDFTIPGAVNLPRPPQVGGPPIAVDLGHRVPGGPELGPLVEAADALVIGGAEESVRTLRQAVEGAGRTGCDILWRGALGPQPAERAASLLAAGADGLICGFGGAEVPVEAEIATLGHALGSLVHGAAA